MLKYKFITLGVYKGDKTNSDNSSVCGESFHARKFAFSVSTEKNIRDLVLKMNTNKPLGPSKIPMWALKDGIESVLPHLTFVLNFCVEHMSFQITSRKQTLFQFSKKMTPKNHQTINPYQ